MKISHLTLQKKYKLLLVLLALISFIFLITALNQIKKVKEYSRLNEEAIALSKSHFSIDSLQKLAISHLELDLNFYINGKSQIINNIYNLNNELIQKTSLFTDNFYLSRKAGVKLLAFRMNQNLKSYNESVNNYTKILLKRGMGDHGLVGEMNVLIASLLVDCKQENLNNLQQKLNALSELKDNYLKNKEITLIHKFRIENEEAKAIALLSAKNLKLAVLSKLQRLEDLLINVSQYDETIGFSGKNGIIGEMKNFRDQFYVNSTELKLLSKAEMRISLIRGNIWLLAMFLVLISVIVLLNRFHTKYFHKPLSNISKFLSEVVKGKLPEPIKFKHNDEITEMAGYLNAFVEGLKTKAEYATEIGKGKLDSLYKPLSEDDILGNALIEMEKSLQKAEYEDQKYKNEEKKRIWANEGIAKFSEILRLHNNDISVLADEIIQNLVKYLNAAQGALFFYNDEDKENIFLELVAAFAFDRKKFFKKTIIPGEGLVGTVALEKQTIFLTEIPDDYLAISSGLGEAPPRSILIVPLKLEDEILGVVELASFSIFAPHEKEFIEKVSQTIASTITSARMNARTTKLLEQSQKQAEEMAEQEEEMRQNMEELRTTQEDFARRETEISSFLNAIQNASMVLIFDNKGIITEANNLFLEVINSKRDDIIGRSFKDFSTLKNSEEQERFWDEIRRGRISRTTEKIRLADGKELFLNQTFSPVFDIKKELQRVICILTDVTELKTNEKQLELKSGELSKARRELELMNSAVDSSFVRCEYSAEGRITYVNENYCRIIGHTKNELVGKINTIYMKDDEKQQFEKIWNEVIKNKPYTGGVKRFKPTGEEIWIMASFTPEVDENGIVIKVFFFGQDITERRLKYQLLEEANKEIERLKKDADKK